MRLDSFFEGFVKEAEAAGLQPDEIRALTKQAFWGKALLGAGTLGLGAFLGRHLHEASNEASTRRARAQMIDNAIAMQRRLTEHRLDTNFMRNVDNYAKGIYPDQRRSSSNYYI